MKLFSCQSCQQILYFESVQCTKCGHALAFLPDRGLVCAIEPAGSATPPLWTVAGDPRATYRLCRNHREYGVCNWAVLADDRHDYCRACRLNRMIPNLDSPAAKEGWHRLEIAKRRVLYTLFELGLPVEPRDERPDGLQFDFLQDSRSPDAPRVSTGHSGGIITINIAEADDPFREKMRVQMGEAYRTVLGHFRHEIGHYYWDRLLGTGPRLSDFRARFGDERTDYAAAQQGHYAVGAPTDWSRRFVSAYASMHPWEDWAETWAHYLHIVDTLETARAYSLSLRPVKEATRSEEPTLAARRLDLHAFEDLIDGWLPLTMALNSLNRSMGMKDYYPFVLSETAIDKLRFVHETVRLGSTATA
jgi:hypothetical protein